jgi:hypothetical protein
MNILLLLQIRKPKPTKAWSADYDDSDSKMVLFYAPIPHFQVLFFHFYYLSLSPGEVIYR